MQMELKLNYKLISGKSNRSCSEIHLIRQKSRHWKGTSSFFARIIMKGNRAERERERRVIGLAVVEEVV